MTTHLDLDDVIAGHQQAAQQLADLRRTLAWYASQAATIQRATLDLDTASVMAIMRTLAMDGGNRAIAAGGLAVSRLSDV